MGVVDSNSPKVRGFDQSITLSLTLTVDLPEPLSLWGSTLGTRAAEHKGCNWACKLTDGCSLKSCVRPHLLVYATEIKSTQLHAAPL